MKKNKLLNFYYSPYRNCPLRCRYCYLPESLKNEEKPSDNEVMQNFISLLNKIESEEYLIGSFCLHGSEPGQMSPECLSDIILKIKNHWRKNGLDNYSVAIQTNGLFFCFEYLQELKKRIESPADFKIGFSIDPPKENHDLLRCNSYDKVFENFHHAVKLGFPVSVLAVVSKETLNHLPLWVQWMKEMKSRKLKYNQPYRLKIKFAVGDQGLSPEEIKEFSEIFISNRLVSLLQILSPEYCLSKGNDCFWLELDYWGECYSCNKTFNIGGGFANWQKESFDQIVRKRKFLFQNVYESLECNECMYQMICSSGCPVDRWQIGNYRGKAHECSAVKTILDNILKKGFSLAEIMNHLDHF